MYPRLDLTSLYNLTGLEFANIALLLAFKVLGLHACVTYYTQLTIIKVGRLNCIYLLGTICFEIYINVSNTHLSNMHIVGG